MLVAMRVDVLVLDHVFDLGLSAVLDAFYTANELIDVSGMAIRPFDVRVIGVRRSVTSAQGFRVPMREAGTKTPDVVVVPAIGFKMPGTLEPALDRAEVRDAAAVLRRWASRGATMSAACIGTFVMAESGVLDGHRATTTWWLAPLFRRRYPNVILEESHMIVKSGRVVTAGAALGHMDLALWLIRSVSPKLAELTARYLIVDSRPSQSAYALTDHLTHDDPLVHRFEQWARAHLTRRFSLDSAARSVAASKRTLARRMHAVLGKTPVAYVQDLRVERALQLLTSGGASVDDVAARVGYADGATLRTLLRRKLHTGIKDIRRL
jgi:transcriptional regulator GlxA family with amidase domain